MNITKNMRKWYENNKAKHISYVRAREKKVRDWLREYKSSIKCEKCDEGHPACLEFHHINPGEKKFSLGRAKNFLTIKTLQNEIAKCRLLCANCHRKEHWDEKERSAIAPKFGKNGGGGET